MLRPWDIPVLATRPWRLVQELDRFSDAECEAVFHDLQRTRLLGLVLAFPIALVLGMSALLLVVGGLEHVFGPHTSWLDPAFLPGRITIVISATLVLVLVPVAALSPYAALTTRAIRRRLKGVSCLACQYPLIGLPAQHGSVVCPECGTTVVLAEHGLRESDLATGVMDRSPGVKPVVPSPRLVTRALDFVLGSLVLLWVIVGGSPWLIPLAVAALVRLSMVGLSTPTRAGSSPPDRRQAPVDPPQR